MPLRQRRAAANDPDQHDVVGPAVALGDFHRDPLDGTPDLRGVERDVGRGGHRAAQKKSRPQKQPGPELYTFIVIPFRYLSSGLKVIRIYDRNGCASTPITSQLRSENIERREFRGPSDAVPQIDREAQVSGP